MMPKGILLYNTIIKIQNRNKTQYSNKTKGKLHSNKTKGQLKTEI